MYIYIYICIYIYILTHFLSFISYNCLAYHKIILHLQNIFFLITIFMRLCSNYVYQLNIFYVSHLNISTLF